MYSILRVVAEYYKLYEQQPWVTRNALLLLNRVAIDNDSLKEERGRSE
jgi:hypothetical protein